MSETTTESASSETSFAELFTQETPSIKEGEVSRGKVLSIDELKAPVWKLIS